MFETRKICDRCKCIVPKGQPLYTVPNPSYSGFIYHAESVPYAIYPKYYELCRDCTDQLIQMFRKFCKNEIE